MLIVCLITLDRTPRLNRLEAGTIFCKERSAPPKGKQALIPFATSKVKPASVLVLKKVMDKTSTRPEDQASKKKATTKWKLSAWSIAANAPIPEATFLDQSAGADTHQPKKAKLSLALGKHVALPTLEELLPSKLSKAKKGRIPKKSSVKAATNAILSKENTDLKALLVAAEAKLEQLHQPVDQSQGDIASQDHLIPQSPGERGKGGWNLRAKIGLGNQSKLYAGVWGIWANARHHCCRKNIMGLTLPCELLDGNSNSNGDDNDDDEAGDEEVDWGNGGNAGEEENYKNEQVKEVKEVKEVKVNADTDADKNNKDYEENKEPIIFINKKPELTKD
ncbi:hypothetical protein FRC00_001651 [Tulasnella sp. 408]|nr:hypothetical protein FRC00_001651 [Tulasnella sp. 408]